MELNRNLPPGFQFSQASLQDFVDCHRRFQLRYIQELAWPALQTEPALENERLLQLGSSFHRLIHQHLLGVPLQRLSATIHDSDLARWWDKYLAWKGWDDRTKCYPEISLSAPLDKYRLVAKYDLILVDAEGSLTIVDWKTYRKRPRRQWLAERFQSRIYPFLVICAGEQLLRDNPLSPERVEMVYWFANFPESPERFSYSAAHFTEDQRILTELVRMISGLGGNNFPMTSRIERCAYCIYRSYCNRGVQAGPLEESEESLELETGTDMVLDMEQIGEIEF